MLCSGRSKRQSTRKIFSTLVKFSINKNVAASLFQIDYSFLQSCMHCGMCLQRVQPTTPQNESATVLGEGLL